MPRPRTAAAVLALVALTLAACGGSGHKAAVHLPVVPPTASAPPGPSLRPTPPPPPRPVVGPPGHLSGLPTRPGSPVLAVKIDNTANGRPQAGLDSADLVYVEQVEGGLTRLLAVFNSRLPSLIGPVRSVRTDNVDLLGEFGAVAFAYSGGQPAALSVVRASALVDDSYDAEPGAYQHPPARYAPYNLFLDPTALLGLRHGIGARDIGLRFDATRFVDSARAMRISVTYPSAQLSFAYDPASRSYALTQDGVLVRGYDGRQVAAQNVIVQHVQQVITGLVDVRGNPTPANVTTGSGDAEIFRDGHDIGAVWTRGTDTAGTSFRGSRSGRDVALRPGTTWILLLPPDGTDTAS